MVYDFSTSVFLSFNNKETLNRVNCLSRTKIDKENYNIRPNRHREKQRNIREKNLFTTPLYGVDCIDSGFCFSCY